MRVNSIRAMRGAFSLLQIAGALALAAVLTMAGQLVELFNDGGGQQ